ncbi:MAG TPA: hypothetical protein VD995_10015 [Azospirillum sp.]|nr:hypothetical protein [Azospirillum sp.]
MRILSLLLFLLVLGNPAFAANPPPADPEERKVAAVFEQARTALQQGRGAAVVPLLSRATLDKLEAVRRAAKAGDRTSLERLGTGEKFAALGLRRHVPPAELRRLEVGGLADHALRQGWLGPNVIQQSTLGPVRVKGDRASALLMVDNKPALVPADFVREAGGWRIDLTSVFNFGGQMLKGFAAMSGKSEEAYIGDLLDKLGAQAKAARR